jgi:DNA polymerase I-like protein with 3'-5' exonuclease and polymerase domains
MKPLVVDVETTTYDFGNPFANRNFLCYVGALSHDGPRLVRCDNVEQWQERWVGVLDGLVVGFNIKFDLHWLRRAGIAMPKKVWDCQFAHYLLQAQKPKAKKLYPSLQEVCEHYGIEGKIGTIEEKYWSKGVDTPAIPQEEMLAYLEQDLRATWAVYHKQVEEFAGNQKLLNLFNLHMDDLLVLQDMEWNGLRLNTAKCLSEAQRVKERIGVIEAQLGSRYPNTPINWDSGDHLSAYLYGGTVESDSKELVGMYASGIKKGQPRYRNIVTLHSLNRLVEPFEGSELAKADKEKGTGPWSTAEDVLKQVKQIPEIKLLLERAELSKLLDYLDGWPSLIREKDWTEGEVHGQFNQVRARTGRLSSSSPNQQNMPDELLKLIETRYAS